MKNNKTRTMRVIDRAPESAAPIVIKGERATYSLSVALDKVRTAFQSVRTLSDFAQEPAPPSGIQTQYQSSIERTAPAPALNHEPHQLKT